MERLPDTFPEFYREFHAKLLCSTGADVLFFHQTWMVSGNHNGQYSFKPRSANTDTCHIYGCLLYTSILACVLGILLMITGLPIPPGLDGAVTAVGNCNTAMSMICLLYTSFQCTGKKAADKSDHQSG